MLSKILGLSKDQIGAAKYALKQHRMGYTLLKNPKGTSKTEVNMIQVMRCVSPDEFRDRSTFINKVTVNIIKGEKLSKSKWIHATRFRDPETKNLSINRNIEYSVIDKSGVRTVKKIEMSEKEIAARKEPRWKEYCGYHEYYSDKLQKEVVNNPARVSYYMNPVAKVIISVLSLGKIKTPPAKPNFYSVLWKNLHNKD